MTINDSSSEIEKKRHDIYNKLMRRNKNRALTQEEIDTINYRLVDGEESEACELFAWLQHESGCFNKKMLQEKSLSLKFLLRVGVRYCETPGHALETIRLLRMHTGVDVNVLIDV